jgi:hypothetical protein
VSTPIPEHVLDRCLQAFEFVKGVLHGEAGGGGSSACGCKVRVAPYGKPGVPVHDKCRPTLLSLVPSQVPDSATCGYVLHVVTLKLGSGPEVACCGMLCAPGP